MSVAIWLRICSSGQDVVGGVGAGIGIEDRPLQPPAGGGEAQRGGGDHEEESGEAAAHRDIVAERAPRMLMQRDQRPRPARRRRRAVRRVPTMLWRGMRRRCAWCGGRRAFFTGCSPSRRRAARVASGGAGDTRASNSGRRRSTPSSRSACWWWVSRSGVIATSPDVAVVPLIVVLGWLAVAIPIVVYPFTYTIWQAVDLAMRPPEPGDGTPPPPELGVAVSASKCSPERSFVDYTGVIRPTADDTPSAEPVTPLAVPSPPPSTTRATERQTP